MTYAKRLEKFNGTQKYMNEVRFLNGLIQGQTERVLDYGCGTGYCARLLQLGDLNVSGYDVNRWGNFKYSDVDGQYDYIYMMHSLAHIDSPLEAMIALRQHLTDEGRIIIITPNKDWLDLIPPKPDYKPDPTVRDHFNQYTLEKLLIDSGYEIEQQGQFGERKGNFNERIFIVGKL